MRGLSDLERAIGRGQEKRGRRKGGKESGREPFALTGSPMRPVACASWSRSTNVVLYRIDGAEADGICPNRNFGFPTTLQFSNCPSVCLSVRPRRVDRIPSCTSRALIGTIRRGLLPRCAPRYTFSVTLLG